MAFLFSTSQKFSLRNIAHKSSQKDLATSAKMIRMWLNFVHTYNPTPNPGKVQRGFDNKSVMLQRTLDPFIDKDRGKFLKIKRCHRVFFFSTCECDIKCLNICMTAFWGKFFFTIKKDTYVKLFQIRIQLLDRSIGILEHLRTRTMLSLTHIQKLWFLTIITRVDPNFGSNSWMKKLYEIKAHFDELRDYLLKEPVLCKILSNKDQFYYKLWTRRHQSVAKCHFSIK